MNHESDRGPWSDTGSKPRRNFRMIPAKLISPWGFSDTMSAIFIPSLANSVNLTRIPNPTLGSLASFHSHTLSVRPLFCSIFYFPRCFRPQPHKTQHTCNIILVSPPLRQNKCVGIETDEKSSTIVNVTVPLWWLPHVVLQKYAYLELPQAV